MPRRSFPASDIRFSASLKAKPEQVYRALTSARELCVWWLERAETDARNMGRMRMVWPAGRRCDGIEARGVFVDLDPGRKVAWILDDGSRTRGVPALVSFFIEGKGRGAQVTLVHAGFSSAPSRERLLRRYQEGWEDCLAKLKLYLDAGKICKGDRLTFADVEALLRKAGRNRRGGAR
ncbi:MAG: SRPBCC domain-containing protein [Elusimicrobiota bacterium]